MKECLILSCIVTFLIILILSMVQFATNNPKKNPESPKQRSVESPHKVDASGDDYNDSSPNIIRLRETGANLTRRFPYLAAILRNETDRTWVVSCYASVILKYWLVTSAHCRNSNHTHKAVLYTDQYRPKPVRYKIIIWRLHENYTALGGKSLKYDIALVKLKEKKDIEFSAHVPKFDPWRHGKVNSITAAVWQTLPMKDKNFLTDVLERHKLLIGHNDQCLLAFGIPIDESLICVYLDENKECYTNEFGPLYEGHSLAGVLTVKPNTCNDRYAIFTNVSYYSTWIFRSLDNIHFS